MEKQTDEQDVYGVDNMKYGHQEITFYKLDENGTEHDGVTLENLIMTCINRLSDLNNKFSCRENACALTKLQEARMWLDERTRDRVHRGVEGKLED